MLHIARSEHDQADYDQAGQGPNSLRFRCLCSADAANYAVQVGFDNVPGLCFTGGLGCSVALGICGSHFFFRHD